MSELMPMILGPNRSYEPPKATAEIRSAQATRGAHMRDDTRLMLQRFYAPFNAELEELPGVKMGWTYT